MNTPPKNYDYQDTFKYQGIAVVGKNGKFGYINSSGKEITPLKYDRVMRFSWGVGKVKLNGKWGLVNIQGKEISPPIYNVIKVSQNPIVKLGNKYGFISLRTGELLTPVKYDKVEKWNDINLFYPDKVNKNLAPVQLDGKWGCVNQRGKETIPTKYDELHIKQYNNPRVVAKLNGKWGYVNDNGKEITSFEFDSVNEFDFCGRALVKKDGKSGFINQQGKIVVPLIYDDCETRFQELGPYEKKQIAPLVVSRNNKYGFVDIDGKEVIELIYDQVLPFEWNDGKLAAAVVLDNKAGFVDHNGKIVVPCQYDFDFDNYNVYKFQGDFAIVKLNGKWGAINTKNQVIIQFLYDDFLGVDVGCFYTTKNGKKIRIDSVGNEWKIEKDPNARTFKDYLHAVSWEEVEKSFKKVIKDEYILSELDIFQINFNNFKNKQFAPSNDVIRIFKARGYEWEHPEVDAALYSVEYDCSFVFFNWEEILDMEVRIEDNLKLSDADVVSICIWEACDQVPITEDNIKAYLKRLDEKGKTIDENFCVV
jgi:hypothetical protein